MINRFCHWVLFKLLGWRLEGSVPTAKKYIFVALPHTSNWDFFYCWLAIRALNLNVTVFVKDVFFVWPITYFCRFFGVAPVNRRESTNFVDSIARQYQEHDELAALITPEGTRKFQPHMKSGYYHLAKQANIPIVVAGPDYVNKIIAIQAARPPLDTFEEDIAQLVEFCYSMNAKKPHYTFTAGDEKNSEPNTP